MRTTRRRQATEQKHLPAAPPAPPEPPRPVTLEEVKTEIRRELANADKAAAGALADFVERAAEDVSEAIRWRAERAVRTQADARMARQFAECVLEAKSLAQMLVMAERMAKHQRHATVQNMRLCTQSGLFGRDAQGVLAEQSLLWAHDGLIDGLGSHLNDIKRAVAHNEKYGFAEVNELIEVAEAAAEQPAAE